MPPDSPAEHPDPLRPADDAARDLARTLLRNARHAALAFRDAATGLPGIARIAFGRDGAGVPLTLVSALTAHTPALRNGPDCAVMLGDPPARGDPLTAPRLMISARAAFVAAEDPDRAALRDIWLRDHPKAKLYIDFADFAFARLHPVSAVLNGGFGRAWRLGPADLAT